MPSGGVAACADAVCANTSSNPSAAAAGISRRTQEIVRNVGKLACINSLTLRNLEEWVSSFSDAQLITLTVNIAMELRMTISCPQTYNCSDFQWKHRAIFPRVTGEYKSR